MPQYSRRNSSTTTQTHANNSVTDKRFDFGSNQEQQNEVTSNSVQDIVKDALDFSCLMVSNVEDVKNNSLDDIFPKSGLSGTLSTASALMNGVQSYQDSPNQTVVGKGLDALLDVSGSLMVGANPVVGVVDTLLPKGMKISEVYDGTSSAMSSMIEGLFTDDTTGMEDFMDKAKDGDYSMIMQEAVRSGEYWAKQF